MANPLVHIIDGSGYIFRAYYAIRALSTADGTPTNAIYGFANMIEKAVREEKPDFLAITFDKGGHNFRKDIYPEYKANRPPPPEDLAGQIPRIHEVAEAFQIKRFVEDGVEADDVIATLVKKALAEGYDVRLITGDKDLMQLVSDRVTLFEPMRGQRFDPKGVEEKMGVPPEQVADLLALAGDSVDNVPGVKGVGPKSAAKLLKAHGDVEGILEAAQAGQVKGKMGQNIAAAVDDVRLSRQLVGLKDDVPLDIESLEALRYPGADKSQLRKLYIELEFRRLVPNLDDEAEETDDAPANEGPGIKVSLSTGDYRTIDSSKALEALVEELSKAERVAIAIETTTPHAVDAKLLSVAVSIEPGKAAYIPVAEVHGGSYLLEDAVLAALKPVLENPNIEKVSAEAKMVHGYLAEREIRVAPWYFDSTLASYLLTPDDLQHGSTAVAKRYLGYDAVDRPSLLRDAKKKRRTFDKVPLDEAKKAVGERADIVLLSYPIMLEAMEKAEVTSVLSDVELPLVPVLARMEHLGIKIDLSRLADMATRFTTEIERLVTKCHEAAGKEFKISSPKQLQKILFEELGLKVIKRTKTGPSTDHSVLEALADEHPLPMAILEYRQLEKLKNTYIDALPKLVSPKTGRVHTVFNQATAATGRLSSTDPNLQNIPIRTDIGRELRKVFIAEEGYRLVSVDYSQIELRVLAHFSQDPVLCQAFKDNADVHTRTASVLFEVAPEEVDREQRTQAKAVNFGVLYGMGPVRLARDLKIPRRTASKFVKDYFARQPGVKTFIDDTLEHAKAHKMVRTLLGRRRWVNDIGSKNRGARAAAERIAVNTPIQGSAADLIKLAMVRVDAVLAERFPSARLLLQVHDELLLEVPEADADAVAAMVKQEMEGIFPLDVPLVAQSAVGKDWDDAH